MKFQLIDRVLDETPDRIVAIKQVSLAEEYLADHFPGYPVLPGVLMLETMVQAARRLIGARDESRQFVLGGVKTLKYGSMVRPGETLRVEVSIAKASEDGTFECRGAGTVVRAPGGSGEETAVSGRFTMRPVRAG